MGGFGDISDIAVSGLVAQRIRMTAAASNLANANTTRTPEGGPYRRRDPVFRPSPVAGPFGNRLDRAMQAVNTPRIEQDRRPPIARHEPGHPDANAQGMVFYPRVNVVEEMTNVMNASRAYESNLVIMRKVRSMGEATIQIGR